MVLVRAPGGFRRVLGELRPGVTILARVAAGRSAGVAMPWTARRTDPERRFERVASCLTPADGLWIAWPKKSSGVRTDLTENVIREMGLEAGLVGNRVCAIDQTWSGLRFVYRVKERTRW